MGSKKGPGKGRSKEEVQIEVEIVYTNQPLTPQQKAARDDFMLYLIGRLLGPEHGEPSTEGKRDEPEKKA